MKNQKGNTAVIAIIIVIVAITAGVIGYLFAKKAQYPTQQAPAIQPAIQQPAAASSEKVNQQSSNATGRVTNSADACAGMKQISDPRDTNNPIYNTVAIGSQCWLNRNLNVGNKIDGAKKQSNNSEIEKFCYEDLNGNCDTDGGLYAWDEAMQNAKNSGAQGICPSGWHIPSDKDWVALESYLWDGIKKEDCQFFAQGCSCGDSRNGFECEPVGDMMRPASACSENKLGYCGTSGFDAIYAGDRNNYAEDIFTYRGQTGLFWSSTQTSVSAAIERHVYDAWNGGVNRGIYDKANAFSIRCIKN